MPNPHTRWRLVRRALGLVAVAGLAVAVARSFRERPIGIDSARATRGTVVVTVDEEGRTRVKSRFQLTAPLTGRLLRVELDPGDPVEIGQPLAAIEPVDSPLLDARARLQLEAEVKAAEAARDEARARAERAQAALEQARWDLDRAQRLLKSGAGTEEERSLRATLVKTAEKEVEAAQFGAQVAAFRLQQAQAALSRPVADGAGGAPGAPGASGVAGGGPQDGAGQAGRAHEIRSPVKGLILRVLREDAGFVAAGTPLLEIGDPRDLEVVVDVLSADAVRVREGARVELGGWGGAAPLPARVRRVEPYAFTKVSTLGIEEQRVNVIVDLDDGASAGSLGDGYSVDARIEIGRADDAVRVPLSALFRAGSTWAVFLVRADKASLTRIEIGLRSDREAEVLAGLAEGDEIVVHPSDALADGKPIERRAP